MTEHRCEAVSATEYACKAEEPAMCCKALTAACLSCAAKVTEAEYCKSNPKTVGCPEKLTCESCKARQAAGENIACVEACATDGDKPTCPSDCSADQQCYCTHEACSCITKGTLGASAPIKQEGTLQTTTTDNPHPTNAATTSTGVAVPALTLMASALIALTLEA